MKILNKEILLLVETALNKLKSIAKVGALVVKNIALFPLRALLFLVEEIGTRFRLSLSYKIAFTYILISTIVFSVFLFGVAYTFRHTWLEGEKEEILIIAEKAATDYRKTGLPYGIETELIDDIIVAREQLDYGVLNSAEKMVQELELNHKLNSGQSMHITQNNRHYLLAVSDFKFNDDVYRLEIIEDISLKIKSLRTQFAITIFSFLLMLFIITYIGHKVNKKLLSPIAEVTAEIKAINISEPNSRLNAQSTQYELKELALQFNRLLDRIEDSYRRNNQFVSDASHELRTPISVIDGYANMLSRWGKNDEKILDEAITEIKSETAYMQNLIEKLLFLARSERGQVDLQIKENSLSKIINEVCREMAMIDDKHEINCQCNNEIFALVDEDFIKQLLRIFIENSRKFTAAGGKITVATSLIKGKPSFTVEDTGIGIPAEDLPQVFDRFYKGDKARSQRKEGNGLGLAIAKWIIDQHGATVEITSEVGKGTKIVVIFT